MENKARSVVWLLGMDRTPIQLIDECDIQASVLQMFVAAIIFAYLYMAVLQFTIFIQALIQMVIAGFSFVCWRTFARRQLLVSKLHLNGFRYSPFLLQVEALNSHEFTENAFRCPTSSSSSRVCFCSHTSNLGDAQGPASIDYRSLLQEDEFHRLADATIQDLQEQFEEYGDSIQIDGFDIDYGNQVLTLKLGGLGTYVLNKQTPNRQIWLSSPVSGPSRFDWDSISQAWVYRRTKENLLQLLERELEQLCGKTINLS